MKRLLREPIARNAGWLIFGKIAQMLTALFVGLLTARYLGPSNYGLVHYAATYTAFFASVCTLGLPSVLVKELLDVPDEQGEILGTALALRATAGAISVVAIAATVAVAETDEPTTVAVTVLSAVCLIFQGFEAFQAWFQAHLRSRVTALSALAAYLLVSAYKLVLLATNRSVLWFAAASTLETFCAGALLLIGYRRGGGLKLRICVATARRLLCRGAHFILPAAMISIYTHADAFMLKRMLGQEQVGYYSTALSLCGMWGFVPTAIIDSVTPSILQAYGEDRLLFEKRNRRLYAIVFYLSAAVSVCLCVVAEPIVRLLYGEAYLPAAQPLRIVTWYTAFAYLGVARNGWIVCENTQKYLIWIYLVAALGNIALNAVLIPIWGASGAAFATLMTQIVTVAVVPLMIGKMRPNVRLMAQGICLKNIR